MRWLFVGLASVGLFAGWWAFWFLCDDAFIAFRYVSNSQLGYGYTWNAPPFRPVEGYSSFLWVFLLDWIWTLTGVEPPEAANPLALGFAFVQLGLIVALVDRLPLTRLEPYRNAVLGVVLLGTLTNRTFLAWTSSGLETAMFDAFVLAWLLAGLPPRARTEGAPPVGNVTALALCASLLELSRPDGLLYCVATVPIAFIARRPRELWPLAIAAIHEGWRLWTYGAPLPNTYYAKVAEPWPLMGSAYLASFLLEYGFWLLLPLAVAAAVHAVRNAPSPRDPTAWLPAAVVGTLAFHFAYYTFWIGGDHFEYRVYAWAVPLVWIGAFRALDALRWRPSRAFGMLAVVWLVGLPLPWTLWIQTRDIEVRHQRGMPTYQVDKHFPLPLRPLSMAFDALQGYTIGHFAGMRSQTHKIYLNYQRSRFPTREEGSKIRGGNPVMAHTSVGWPAWSLPHVAIIDEYGLNDAVIARNREPRRRSRLMAHERKPPAGYVGCFLPDIRFDKQGQLLPRPTRQLTDDDIVRCEAKGWSLLAR
ncbi:MAG: hypothetical protein R3F61_17215 [Myxococcota bacterium]